MYVIKIDGKDLYYPGDDECVISEAKLSEAVGDSGSLDIVVPQTNPYFDKFRQRSTELSLYKDDVLLFNGEVREISEDFLKNKKVYAVGELSYLKDSMQDLQELNGTRAQIFSILIASHNSQVEARKRFTVGAIGKNSSATIKVTAEYESTFDVLSKLLDDTYFRIRHEGNVRYLDIMPLEDYGVKSEQYVEFSENLIDYAMSTSSESLATACIPLGQSLDDSPVEDSTAYIDIKTDDHSDWDTPDEEGFIIHDNYIYNEAAVNNYGWIKRFVHFNVLNTRAALITAAKNWLRQNQFEEYTYELTAFDLSNVDAQADDYSVGDYIRCISEPHGMDAWLPVRNRETDLLNPANNKITVGAEGQKTLTQSINSQITDLVKEMPDESEILKAALKNASNLINSNGTNGYVSIRTDENNKPYEIIIMDAPSIEQATHGWRWNLNGFGHGTKEAGESEFEWTADVAITMDGSFVADYITTGTMLADRIHGGVLTLGGLNNDSGQLIMQDADGNQIGKWDKDGIEATAGLIANTWNIESDGLSNGKNAWLGANLIACGSAGGTLIRLIGSSTASNRYVEVTSSQTNDYIRMGFNNTGTHSIKRRNSVVQWAVFEDDSDVRLKEDILDIDTESVRDLFKSIRPVQFRIKDDKKHILKYGLIAQELEQAIKDSGLDTENIITCNDGEYLHIEYNNLHGFEIAAIKDLQEQINELKGANND